MTDYKSEHTIIPTTEKLPSEEMLGVLEPVAYFDGPMPTGVTVSRKGRIFVNFPRWGDEVLFTVAEVRDGKPVAYPPNETMNQSDPQDLAAADASSLVSVQSVVVDPADRLWILDTGSPMFQPTKYGGPKLVCVDLNKNQVIKKILFPQSVALPTTYLNDVRFDLGRGREGVAYITDSAQNGPNGIIVVDLASGDSWRRLHDHPSTKAEDIRTFLPIVEGRPFLVNQEQPQQLQEEEKKNESTNTKLAANMGSDGIAISATGEKLYYCPLASRRLYSVSTEALYDRSIDDQHVSWTVKDEGDKGGASDGLESDSEGSVYATNYEHNAIMRRNPNGEWETLIHDPRLLWPDTLSLASDGYLYVTANQLHRQARFHNGRDMRKKPYTLFRINVNSNPVLLLR